MKRLYTKEKTYSPTFQQYFQTQSNKPTNSPTVYYYMLLTVQRPVIVTHTTEKHTESYIDLETQHKTIPKTLPAKSCSVSLHAIHFRLNFR